MITSPHSHQYFIVINAQIKKKMDSKQGKLVQTQWIQKSSDREWIDEPTNPALGQTP